MYMYTVRYSCINSKGIKTTIENKHIPHWSEVLEYVEKIKDEPTADKIIITRILG